MKAKERLAQDFVEKMSLHNARLKEPIPKEQMDLVLYLKGFHDGRQMAADYLLTENAEFYSSMVRNVGEHNE